MPEPQANADSLLRRTARGAGWVMAWRLGMRVLGLVSTLVLVRLIAPADFGIIALATSFMQTIDGMLDPRHRGSRHPREQPPAATSTTPPSP